MTTFVGFSTINQYKKFKIYHAYLIVLLTACTQTKNFIFDLNEFLYKHRF
jgi:hypothetical protein